MAVAIKADFVGLSFVRRPEDVEAVRARLPKRGHRPQLVAKIETAVALDHLPGIVGAADAVMVARGDLGIQVPARRVPLIQKEIIRFCNMAGKPVITATQMLESMTRSPLPTRAEVNDVANAVLDGTDALMLSEETAVGEYPADTVRTMSEVAEAAEAWPQHAHDARRARPPRSTTTGSRGRSRTRRCRRPRISASPRSCARRRAAPPRAASPRSGPSVPIVGISEQPEVLGRLCLVWGVQPAGRRRRCDGDDRLAARGARPRATAASRARATSSRSCPRRRASAPARTDTVRIVRV